MMISPESYINQHKETSYAELLNIRDKLIIKVRNYETNKNNVFDEAIVHPSPEVVYQCNLQYLAKLFELIAQKYSEEFVWNKEPKTEHYLFILRSYLERKGYNYVPALATPLQKRKMGVLFTLSDHLKALIYSMLTNQTKWHRIEPNLHTIDRLFFNFDVEKIKAAHASTFSEGLFAIKCGNISTASQMESLHKNIAVFEKIEKEKGSLDTFVLSAPASDIARMFSRAGSPYKLRMLGEALVWEYLRNVGIDGAKPDVHVRRFLGADRMGCGDTSPASINDVYKQVEILANETGLSKVEIDSIIWSFCADGYGAVCASTPRCKECPIRSYCNH